MHNSYKGNRIHNTSYHIITQVSKHTSNIVTSTQPSHNNKRPPKSNRHYDICGGAWVMEYGNSSPWVREYFLHYTLKNTLPLLTKTSSLWPSPT